MKQLYKPDRLPAERSAFTLVELVVSVAISSILIVGLTSSLFVALRAIDPPNRVDDVLKASEVTFDLTDELRYAIHVTSRSSTMIEFVVADRNGDAQADVIKYEWSGTVGDPLTRSFNHETPINVAADVQEFALTYDVRTKDEQFSGQATESSESVLTQETAAATPLYDRRVNATTWFGQYFHPNAFNVTPLPGNATSWKVTRVEYVARKIGSADGQFDVQLREADGSNLPVSAVLGAENVNENTLSSNYAWDQVTFAAPIAGLSTSTGYCLVLKRTGGNSDVVELDVSGVPSGLLRTTDSGASWVHRAARRTRYKIYGTYTVPGSPMVVTRSYLTGVGIQLRLGDDPNSQINTNAQLLNSPELLSAFWKLDFDQDPRTVDSNFDGVNDWSDWEAPFDPANLVGGIWYSPSFSSPNRHILQTRPDNNFVKPVTVNLRFKCTSVGGSGTYFWINADRSGSHCAPLMFDLYMPNASTQELWVGELTSSGSRWDKVYTVANDQFIDMRLVIDPVTDTYSVFIDGVFMDTFAYVGTTFYSDDVAFLYTKQVTGEFDSCSILVSE